jgi:hypothetical protein
MQKSEPAVVSFGEKNQDNFSTTSAFFTSSFLPVLSEPFFIETF